MKETSFSIKIIFDFMFSKERISNIIIIIIDESTGLPNLLNLSNPLDTRQWRPSVSFMIRGHQLLEYMINGLLSGKWYIRDITITICMIASYDWWFTTDSKFLQISNFFHIILSDHNFTMVTIVRILLRIYASSSLDFKRFCSVPSVPIIICTALILPNPGQKLVFINFPILLFSLFSFFLCYSHVYDMTGSLVLEYCY